MKLALMQPYLFPYIGYFKLVAGVDKFVFYDDVNYIKNGWINRNRILAGTEVRYITVPLAGASSSVKINEVIVQPRDLWLRKLLESVRHSYAKAPHFARINELIADVLGSAHDQISALASLSVIEVAGYLALDTNFVRTSATYGNAHLHGATRVLDICAKERTGTYLNLPGGRALYQAEDFHAAGMELEFVDPDLRPYPQFGSPFEPGLSILDALMFNEAEQVKDMLIARVMA